MNIFSSEYKKIGLKLKLLSSNQMYQACPLQKWVADTKMSLTKRFCLKKLIFCDCRQNILIDTLSNRPGIWKLNSWSDSTTVGAAYFYHWQRDYYIWMIILIQLITFQLNINYPIDNIICDHIKQCGLYVIIK